MILFIQLFLAHIIGDFFLQPAKWVEQKEQKKLRSVYLYLHVLIHFSLIIAITGDLAYWKIALTVAIAHLIIDGAKLSLQRDDTARVWFIADQLMHLAVILIVWTLSEHRTVNLHALYNKEVLVPVTAILFVLNPASFIIKTVISKWTPGNEAQQAGATGIDKSLENAGQLIGVMERLMVLVFVFLGKWEGVGFLLAAKSVFRFGDLKDAKNMKLTEYVLIGTFLSFGMAIITSLVGLALMGK